MVWGMVSTVDFFGFPSTPILWIDRQDIEHVDWVAGPVAQVSGSPFWQRWWKISLDPQEVCSKSVLSQ